MDDSKGSKLGLKEIEKFKNTRILHPKMILLLNHLKSLINQPGGNELIILMGPSGVGKSTLVQQLQKRIIQDTLEELEDNKSKLPFVSVELVSPDNGLFNWKDLYIRTLESMNEPLINKKILYNSDNEQPQKFANHNPRTAPELRRSVENAFYFRAPKVFIIDEAQHFTKMSSGKRYTDQLDTLKSLSNLTKIPLLLVGTYEMSDFINLNGQLARRTFDIQFPRYNYANHEDIISYVGVIQSLMNIIPIPTSSDIISHHEFIYERTLGCVGILKDWLLRALKAALEEKSEEFTFTHLEETALSINKISKLLDEILLGESVFIEDQEVVREVQKKLGLSSNTFGKEVVKKNKVGVRNPKRDKTGRV